MQSDGKQKRNFDRVANTTYSWCMSAQSLIFSARIIYDRFVRSLHNPSLEDSFLLPPAILLYGFGLECLFKGLWVHNGNKIAEDGKYIGVKGSTDHNLQELANAVDFDLSQDERGLLKRLSILITSTSRYPVAKNWSKTRITRDHNGGWFIPTVTSSKDLGLLESMIERIYIELDWPVHQQKDRPGSEGLS